MQNIRLQRQTQKCETQQQLLFKLAIILIFCITVFSLVLLTQPWRMFQTDAAHKHESQYSQLNSAAVNKPMPTQNSAAIVNTLQQLRMHNVMRNLSFEQYSAHDSVELSMTNTASPMIQRDVNLENSDTIKGLAEQRKKAKHWESDYFAQ